MGAARTAGGLRLYAVVSSKEAGGLYRSDDACASWMLANSERAFTGYYASRVTVDPTDPDVVWLVGQSIRRCSDGGRACQIVKGAPGGDDYHFVWIDPRHPDHRAVASDQGALVQRLTSEPSARRPAEVYFAPDWLRPTPPLATSAGLHRTVWNLRWSRPPAIAFDYSISTAAGADTPAIPRDPWHCPATIPRC